MPSGQPSGRYGVPDRLRLVDLVARGSLLVNDGYRTRVDELGRPGIPVLRVAEVQQGHLTPTFGDHVLEGYRSKIADKLSRPRDVVVTTKGTVGRVALMPADGSEFVYSPQVCFFRCLDDSIDARWLYYWFRGPEFTGQASGVQAQTDMAAYINLADMRAMRLTLPELTEQRAVAATLGALDDKIESDRRTDELCLALAVETYRGACLKASQRLALGDAGKWLSGGTPSTEEPAFWSGDFPWISAANLKSFHVAVSDRRLTSAGLQRATNVVPAGTVLLVVRGMSLKSELRMGVAQRPVAFGQDVKAIIPTGVPSALLATALYSARSDILELVDEAGHGTGRLQWDLLSAFPIAIPDDERVVPVLDGLLARAAAASAESRKLAELRDALLPELLSGRIRAPEVATT